MKSRVASVQYAPSVTLGEPVAVRIGQTAAFLQQPDGTTELYMVSNGAPAIFYAISLPSGEVLYEYAIPRSHAVWGMTVLDDTVYFGATDNHILYRYQAKNRQVEEVGTFPSGPFVWDMAVSADDLVFGSTYPEAQIFEYNPATNQFADLGRMDEMQHYVRGMAAVDHYLFAGIGSELRLVQYDRNSKTKKELSVAGFTGQKGFISRIFDSPVENTIYLFVSGYHCVVYNYEHQEIIDSFAASSFMSKPSPYNGEQYYIHQATLYSYNPHTKQQTKHIALPLSIGEMLVKSMVWVKSVIGDYSLYIATTNMDIIRYCPITDRFTTFDIAIPNQAVSIQSLEWDRQEKLYIGGYHRGLSVYNTTTAEVEMNLTTFPQIEGIGFSQGHVYFGTYTKANIYHYNPSADKQPAFLYQVGAQQDRPFAVAEAGNKMFFGTIADYGILTGAISMYDTETGSYETFNNVVPNQSIIGLVYQDGLLYGGTTNWGGIGIEAIETEAKLFVWDVAAKQCLHSFTPNIPGIDIPPRMIGELSFGPDGLLWGAADGTIFAICTETLQVVKSKFIFPSEYKYTHLRPYFLRWSSDGLLFASLARKIVAIDPDTMEHQIIEDEAIPLMTLGPNDDLYYNNGAELMMRKRIK